MTPNPTGEGRGRRVSRPLALAIIALLVMSVPWYFPSGDGRPLVLGVPLWSIISFGCYVGIAAIVAALLPRLWDDSTDEESWRR